MFLSVSYAGGACEHANRGFAAAAVLFYILYTFGGFL
jgi:hypothetical protein